MSLPINPKEIFVIIPAYNEYTTIQSVIAELLPYHFTLLLIDDGSEKNLYSFVKKTPAYFLRHRVNLGQGAAIQTGIEFAISRQAKYIVTFDADGQHLCSDINKLVQVLTDDKLDIVLGSRFIRGAAHNMPAKRKTLLGLARYVNYFFTGLLLTDAHNGLRVMTIEAAKKINLHENRMAHATELLSQIKKRKLRYAEAPATVSYTAYSRQKGQTIWSGFRIFFDLLLNKIFR